MKPIKQAFSDNHYRLALIKPYIGRMLLGLLFMTIAIAIQLSFPSAIAYFIDNASGQQDTAWLSTAASIMLILFVIYCLATALRYYLFESTGTLLVMSIRRQLHRAIIDHPISFFDTHKVGELSSRLSSDVEAIKASLSMGLAIGLRSILTCVGGTIMLLTISVQLTLIVLLVVPVSIKLAKWLGHKTRSQSKAVQDSMANSLQLAQENFANVRLVHAFNQQEKSNQKYNLACEQAQQHSLTNARLFSLFQGLSTFITYSLILVTLWIGGQLIATGAMSVGELTSFVIYAGMVAAAASNLSGFWGEWMRAVGATERVFEMLNNAAAKAQLTANSQPPLKEALSKEALSTGVLSKGELSFEQVNFNYPGRANETALEQFNLNIKSGEKIAIVGPSGAGKSTVAKLLLGFYCPSSGTIKFDGIEAQHYSIDLIREAIATVEQEPTLFNGTILDNIGYAFENPEQHIEQIQTAAKLANADDFINQFKHGYQTMVGERGAQLSGGQKQRIAIARALIKNPKILILDEATSALDAQSEQQVQLALENLMKGRTTIMIAHRYSTIATADKLVVMQDGKIAQFGTHEQLFSDKNGLYFQLMTHQITANAA